MILSLNIDANMELKTCKKKFKRNKMAPKWSNLVSKPASGGYQNEPGGHNMAQTVPRWSQGGSKSFGRPPEMATRCFKMAHVGSTWLQEGPKWPQRDPRWPQDYPKRIHKGPNWIPKWNIVCFKKRCIFLVFSMKMTYWRLEMEPLLDVCGINDMTWCHFQSMHAHVSPSWPTWWIIEGHGALQGPSKGGPRAPHRARGYLGGLSWNVWNKAWDCKM